MKADGQCLGSGGTCILRIKEGMCLVSEGGGGGKGSLSLDGTFQRGCWVAGENSRAGG